MPTLTKKLSDLALSPVLARMHELADDHPEYLALVESIRDHGLLAPFVIDEDDQILDGRHRRRACKLLGIKEVPVEVRDSSEAMSIALEALLARRHYSKGALAYTALPLLERAAAEGVARRAAALKKGQKPVTQKIKVTEKPPLTAIEEAAERLGLSLYYVESARRMEKAFVAAEERIERWLKLNPEAADTWDAWDKAMPMAWGHFSADYRRENEEATLIPENYRETYAGKLLDGSMSIEAIHKGIGGALATKGRVRNDKTDDPGLAWDTVNKRILALPQHLWGNWEVLDADSQAHAALAFSETAQSWPEAVQAQVLATLKAAKKGGAKP